MECICTKYSEWAILDDDPNSEEVEIQFLPGNVYECWLESNKVWGDTYHVRFGDKKIAFSNLSSSRYNFNDYFDLIT